MHAKKLLVVDDDAGVVDFLCESLVERGFHVESQTSPEVALERITADAFDLVITDLQMPGMRGTDMLAAIRPSEILAHGALELRFGDLRVIGGVDEADARDVLTGVIQTARIRVACHYGRIGKRLANGRGHIGEGRCW